MTETGSEEEDSSDSEGSASTSRHGSDQSRSSVKEKKGGVKASEGKSDTKKGASGTSSKHEEEVSEAANNQSRRESRGSVRGIRLGHFNAAAPQCVFLRCS